MELLVVAVAVAQIRREPERLERGLVADVEADAAADLGEPFRHRERALDLALRIRLERVQTARGHRGLIRILFFLFLFLAVLVVAAVVVVVVLVLVLVVVVVVGPRGRCVENRIRDDGCAQHEGKAQA
jgi:Flp pilus assembly protein TadB